MKGTNQIIELAKLLDAYMNELNDKNNLSLRILSITSPKPEGDIEIVFDDNRSITYRSDGTFTGLSYWQEFQI